MQDILGSIKEIGVMGFLDILFMFLLLYTLFIAFKRTRAAFVLRGIFIVACVYLLTRQFNLIMTATVFEKFVTVIFIVLVVIFQEELRHFFEEIASWSLKRPDTLNKSRPLSRDETQLFVKVLMELSRDKIGALIVIRGKNILVRHLDGEVPLNGQLSEPILKSIFDPHSIGHDGAVIIDGNWITHFAAHLPLSKNLENIRDRGTRHAAALGISEVTDALCLVVSEERGSISVARHGTIYTENNPDRVTTAIENFYEEIRPKKQVKAWEEFFKSNSREKVYAILLALGLWFVLVHGSKIVYRSYVIPVSYGELPSEWSIVDIDPKALEIRLKGPRTSFYLNIRDRIKVYPDIKMQSGPQRIRVYEKNFVYPKSLNLDEYDPHYISVTLDKKPQEITPQEITPQGATPQSKNGTE
jgi:uncharacterized protein (TIGR00159 family)